jgi:segregation and condensation protein B
VSEQERDNQVPPPAEEEPVAPAEAEGDEPLLTPAEEAALAEASERTVEPEEAPDESGDSDESDESDDSDETADAADKAPREELPPEAVQLCKSAIEAMLFSSAEPLTSRKLAEPLKEIGADGNVVRRIVRDLIQEYEASRRGFTVEEVAGGFQMMTRPDYAEFVNVLHQSGSGGGRLSQAALETLAVVAYKQPVARADIEAIRGVQAGPLLRTLLQKGLVKITGRAEVIGRPLLYGTSKKFLEVFGLKSINELPKVEELPRP